MLAWRRTEDDGRLGALVAQQRIARTPATLAVAWLLATAVLSPAAPAWAQSRFDIRSAYVEPRDDVYHLNATLELTVPQDARDAIDEGVPLTLDLEIVVRRSRRYWLDETVATLEQHYELVHHALSERYLVRNLNSGEQSSFATLDAALDTLRVISNLPILDSSLVAPEGRHEIGLRAILDVPTMPDALRFVLFWREDWRQVSEWYTWSPQM